MKGCEEGRKGARAEGKEIRLDGRKSERKRERKEERTQGNNVGRNE